MDGAGLHRRRERGIYIGVKESVVNYLTAGERLLKRPLPFKIKYKRRG